MIGSRLLSGLNLRLRFRSSARQSRSCSRSRRRAGNRPDAAAEVCRPEARSMLSTIDAFGYQWNTNYWNSADQGTYSGAFRQDFSPNNVTNENGQIQLYLRDADINGTTKLASSEVEMVGTTDESKFPFPGYGTYLVSAYTSGGFNSLAANNGVVFGAFTFQNLAGNATKLDGKAIQGLPESLIAKLKKGMLVSGENYKGESFYPAGTIVDRIEGGTVYVSNDAKNVPDGDYQHTVRFVEPGTTKDPNNFRELDMIEVVRPTSNTQPDNAQFTLQPWDKNPDNVHRFTLPNTDNITLVMKWEPPKQSHERPTVTFEEYDGQYTLSNLPATPSVPAWKVPARLSEFIPTSKYQAIHFNLWHTFWRNVTPTTPAEVTITNFQYKK